jgi:hypothetical protein
MRQVLSYLSTVFALTALLSPAKPLPAAPTSPKPVSTTPIRARAPTTEHPRHQVKVWLTTYRSRTFRVIQLPRCEHLEAAIAYASTGETKEQAKHRLNGIAVSTAAFHDPRSLALVDFYQSDGKILSGATTGRWFFAAMENGEMRLTGDYPVLKGKSGVTALALGQRLVPLERDGFSKAFMDQRTDRMAIGMVEGYLYIVEGKTDLWRLSEFLRTQLPIETALNADGGHVVDGKSPVHIVFRWRTPPPPSEVSAAQAPAAPLAPES